MSQRRHWFCVVLSEQSTDFYLLDSWVGLDLTLPNGVICSAGGAGLFYDFMRSANTQRLVAVDLLVDSNFDSIFEGRADFRLIERISKIASSTWRLVLEDCPEVVAMDLFILGDILGCRECNTFAFDASVLSDEDYRTVSAFVAAHTLTGS